MKKILFLLFGFFLYNNLLAHPLPHIQTENIPLSATEIFLEYLKLGFSHVIPSGTDHILFILGIFFLNSNFKSVLIQCTVFTLAHSISLGLAASGVFLPVSAVIEPLIALTIIFVALENIYLNKVNARRLVMIFCFGIIHGLGFASAIKETGLSKTHFIISLFSFNIGVEIGQIVILTLAYLTIVVNFREYKWYKKYVTNPISILISLVGLYWFIERIMN